MRDGHCHFDRASLTAALDGSLRRLQTDYLDLYQLHWPDRNVNYFGMRDYPWRDDAPGSVEIAETLEVLQSFVTAGKVRAIGLSNETPWGLSRFLTLAEQQGLPRVVSIQNAYSLLNRSFEVALAEFSHREQVGLLAYSPLAFGRLSGKYEDGARPDGARLTMFERFARYNSPQSVAAATEYVALARRQGLSPAQMALAFVNSRPFVTSNIIGATSLAQLNENLDSAALTLDAATLEMIETIHRCIPTPAP